MLSGYSISIDRNYDYYSSEKSENVDKSLLKTTINKEVVDLWSISEAVYSLFMESNI